MNFILPLAITLALETGIYMILKHRDLKLFIVASIMNLVLNLSMNIGLYFIKDETIYWVILSISEVSTVMIESLIVYLFTRIKYLKVLLFAFLANLTSFSVGLLITPIYQTKIAAIVVCSLFFVIYLITFGFAFSSFMFHHIDHDNRGDSTGDHQGESHN